MEGNPRESFDLRNRSMRRMSHTLFERRPFGFIVGVSRIMDPRYGDISREALSLYLCLSSLEVWKLEVCSKVDRGWEDLGR